VRKNSVSALMLLKLSPSFRELSGPGKLQRQSCWGQNSSPLERLCAILRFHVTLPFPSGIRVELIPCLGHGSSRRRTSFPRSAGFLARSPERRNPVSEEATGLSRGAEGAAQAAERCCSHGTGSLVSPVRLEERARDRQARDKPPAPVGPLERAVPTAISRNGLSKRGIQGWNTLFFVLSPCSPKGTPCRLSCHRLPYGSSDIPVRLFGPVKMDLGLEARPLASAARKKYDLGLHRLDVQHAFS